MEYLNEEEVRKAVLTLKPEGSLFEVRIISPYRKAQSSGYFQNADVLARALKGMDLRGSNAYIVLNTINDACYGRVQRDRFVSGATSTSDADIVMRDWILVDFDPKRPAGTSATDDQVRKAGQKCSRVMGFLTEQGFSKPVIAFSGNGYHLLYRISMQANEGSRNLLKNFLAILDEMFSDNDVGIDHVNFNEARICKLYGTLSQKGANTAEFPHRMSRIVSIPPEVKTTDEEYFLKVCRIVRHEKVRPSKYNGYSAGNFELESWLEKYAIAYQKSPFSNGMKYVLDHCPFNENHRGKDAAIFKTTSGAIGFHCFHNSCADKQWQDVRLLFEPDAYSRKWAEEEKRAYSGYNRDYRPRQIAPKDDIPVFMTARQVLEMPHPPEAFVKTGIVEIDRRLRGLKKGHVSVWSGLRGSAKSTVLSQICLNAIDNRLYTIMYSGEMNSQNVVRWLMQQAAGRSNVEPGRFEGYYNVPEDCRKLISDWIGDYFWIYNNAYGNSFTAFAEQLERQIAEKKIDFVVLDNLMAFDIRDLAESKWDAQTAFVWRLHEMADRHNVHIAFVAHPKKALGFLRFDDISGTADLGNAVQEAFIVHRNNDDFRRLFQAMYKDRIREVESGTNIIEIVKDRDGGTQDVFIPLWYERESKRLKNDFAENRVYGWEQEKPDTVIDDDNPFV